MLSLREWAIHVGILGAISFLFTLMFAIDRMLEVPSDQYVVMFNVTAVILAGTALLVLAHLVREAISKEANA